jgi:hypothetical protein
MSVVDSRVNNRYHYLVATRCDVPSADRIDVGSRCSAGLAGII